MFRSAEIMQNFCQRFMRNSDSDEEREENGNENGNENENENSSGDEFQTAEEDNNNDEVDCQLVENPGSSNKSFTQSNLNIFAQDNSLSQPHHLSYDVQSSLKPELVTDDMHNLKFSSVSVPSLLTGKVVRVKKIGNRNNSKRARQNWQKQALGNNHLPHLQNMVHHVRDDTKLVEPSYGSLLSSTGSSHHRPTLVSISSEKSSLPQISPPSSHHPTRLTGITPPNLASHSRTSSPSCSSFSQGNLTPFETPVLNLIPLVETHLSNMGRDGVNRQAQTKPEFSDEKDTRPTSVVHPSRRDHGKVGVNEVLLSSEFQPISEVTTTSQTFSYLSTEDNFPTATTVSSLCLDVEQLEQQKNNKNIKINDSYPLHLKPKPAENFHKSEDTGSQKADLVNNSLIFPPSSSSSSSASSSSSSTTTSSKSSPSSLSSSNSPSSAENSPLGIVPNSKSELPSMYYPNQTVIYGDGDRNEGHMLEERLSLSSHSSSIAGFATCHDQSTHYARSHSSISHYKSRSFFRNYNPSSRFALNNYLGGENGDEDEEIVTSSLNVSPHDRPRACSLIRNTQKVLSRASISSSFSKSSSPFNHFKKNSLDNTHFNEPTGGEDWIPKCVNTKKNRLDRKLSQIFCFSEKQSPPAAPTRRISTPQSKVPVCQLGVEGLTEDRTLPNGDQQQPDQVPEIAPTVADEQKSSIINWTQTLEEFDYKMVLEHYGIREIKRQQLIWELIQTEGSFIKSLKFLISKILKPIISNYQPLYRQEQLRSNIDENQNYRGDDSMNNPQLDFLLRCRDDLELILALHSTILSTLQAQRSREFERLKPFKLIINFSSVLIDLIQNGFKVHERYIIKSAELIGCVKKFEDNSESNQIKSKDKYWSVTDQALSCTSLLQNQCRSMGIGSMELISYLLKPVQRLMKYPLFFHQISDLTPNEHPDCEAINDLLSVTDRAIRNIEHSKSIEDDYKTLKSLETRLNVKDFLIGQRFELANRKRTLLNKLGHFRWVEFDRLRTSDQELVVNLNDRLPRTRTRIDSEEHKTEYSRISQSPKNFSAPSSPSCRRTRSRHAIGLQIDELYQPQRLFNQDFLNLDPNSDTPQNESIVESTPKKLHSKSISNNFLSNLNLIKNHHSQHYPTKSPMIKLIILSDLILILKSPSKSRSMLAIPSKHLDSPNGFRKKKRSSTIHGLDKLFYGKNDDDYDSRLELMEGIGVSKVIEAQDISQRYPLYPRVLKLRLKPIKINVPMQTIYLSAENQLDDVTWSNFIETFSKKEFHLSKAPSPLNYTSPSLSSTASLSTKSSSSNSSRLIRLSAKSESNNQHISHKTRDPKLQRQSHYQKLQRPKNLEEGQDQSKVSTEKDEYKIGSELNSKIARDTKKIIVMIKKKNSNINNKTELDKKKIMNPIVYNQRLLVEQTY